MSRTPRGIEWVGSSQKDLLKLPTAVVEKFGAALHKVQLGHEVPHAKPMKGFLKGQRVMEIALRYRRDAYRCVYVVTLPDAVYVLHCFQKKSKSGIATPQPDIDLIRARLKAAVAYSQTQKRN